VYWRSLPGVKEIRMRGKTRSIVKVIDMLVTGDMALRSQDDPQRAYQDIGEVCGGDGDPVQATNFIALDVKGFPYFTEE